jgi:drug/metabolite transporter (DMT)-like permease
MNIYLIVYFVLVLISSILWAISSYVTPPKERYMTDNLFFAAVVNLFCIPLVLFFYFTICSFFQKNNEK